MPFSISLKTVTDAWLREQTTTPSTNGWYSLVIEGLGEPYTIRGVKCWSEEAVRAAFKSCRST